MVFSLDIDGIGPLLADVRNQTGKKQSELAEALTVSTSRISRIETGDLTPDPDEVRRYLEFVGTDAARSLLAVLNTEWRHMPRPSHSHPQLDALKKAESFLSKIDAFVEEPDVPKTLLKQAALHRESLRRMAEYLSSLHHTAAYIGEIGAGKTTGICLQTGLMLGGVDKNGIRLVALDTGSGRTTICEVRIRAGSGCGLLVFPASDSEVHKLIGEFCEGVWAVVKASGAHPDEPKGVSTEIDRALRNMAGLARTSRILESGKRVTIDPAATLARVCTSIEDFRSSVAEQLKLAARRTVRHGTRVPTARLHSNGCGSSFRTLTTDEMRPLDYPNASMLLCHSRSCQTRLIGSKSSIRGALTKP
jgi:transcriptional regulator with XRE-family HTH domain